jgi:hypothetical protein
MIPALINLIVWLLVIGILYWLVIYIIDTVPIPDPPARIIKIGLIVALTIVVILMLLDLIGVNTGVNMPSVTG